MQLNKSVCLSVCLSLVNLEFYLNPRLPNVPHGSSRFFKVPKGYPRIPKLACSSMSLYTVPWVCMQLHKLACSSKSLYAVP